MTDSIKEQLSACLDGELPDQELALLLKRIDHDTELRGAITRYGLISETLRTGSGTAISADFAARVMTRIEAEPKTPASKVSPRLLRRLRPVAGIAVAASVAALAVFSVQRSGLFPTQAIIASQNESANAPVVAEDVPDRYVVPATPSSSSAFIPATRLTNYVVAHSEYSSPLGRRSVLSGVLAEGEAELLNEPTEEAVAPQGTQR
jgi:sigma-E factor negative regulatory protein RseA